jgi:predicted ester cyclase
VSVEDNKRLVARFLDEVYNQGNLAVADELVARDYTSHNRLEIEVLGPEGIKATARAQRAAFPDQRTHLDELIAEGDKVVVRGRDTGTHTGEPFAGIQASGRPFEITWIDIFRVEDGLLREAWLEIDTAAFRRQLTGEGAEAG